LAEEAAQKRAKEEALAGDYSEMYLQLRRRTLELLYPHLERAAAEAKDETYEIQTELANLRNQVYCRTEGRGDAPAKTEAKTEDWLD
jgi:hypothetical protein